MEDGPTALLEIMDAYSDRVAAILDQAGIEDTIAADTTVFTVPIGSSERVKDAV